LEHTAKTAHSAEATFDALDDLHESGEGKELAHETLTTCHSSSKEPTT
jgi:hypothetical protein